MSAGPRTTTPIAPSLQEVWNLANSLDSRAAAAVWWASIVQAVLDTAEDDSPATLRAALVLKAAEADLTEVSDLAEELLPAIGRSRGAA